jgi:hypothetical protein
MRPPAELTVLIEPRPLQRFLAAAIGQYKALTPLEPRPCFAVLLGRIDGGTAHIQDVDFGGNARASDPAAVEEFAASIVPQFGAAYENPVRGYWLDSRDLLRISRRADDLALDILGSIHMHPDWHRIGPPPAETMPLSERPTSMDEYVFGSTLWPVNVICYLERLGESLCYSLRAWGQPADPSGGCPSLPLRIRTDVPGLVPDQSSPDQQEVTVP